MNDLLERLRRNDPSALEELGHELLPFVQAAMLAQGFLTRDPAALLQAFREAVASSQVGNPATFNSRVVEQVRSKSGALPTVPPDGAQAEALARIALLQPLNGRDREVVMARFVERLPGHLITAHFGLQAADLPTILARGAALLVGPAPGGDWSTEPSLIDPDAPPAAPFVALENQLTTLAIDVTALERQPLISSAPAPVPVLKSGYELQAPAESYPSRVETQGSVDLPADVSKFVKAPRPSRPSVATAPMPAPSAPRPSRPSVATTPMPRPSAPAISVVVSPSLDETPGAARPVQEEATQPQGRPLKLPPPPEETEVRGKPLIAVPSEHTEPRGAPLVLPPVETTDIGVALARPPPLRVLPLHRRIPGVWWLGGAGLCAVLGVSLYWGMVANLKTAIRRPWTMVPVIVATQDLTEGAKITIEMVATRAIPEQYATQSVVKPESLEYALGQKLEFPLQAGDPLLWAQFDPVRRNKRFDVTRRGRAYTIPVTELKSLGGQLMPNEEVDLLMTVNYVPGQQHSELGVAGVAKTITLMQKVRVLAVGSVSTFNIGRTQRRFTDITLMLVPEEVEVLSLALRTGELTATLRNFDDTDVIERGETTLQTLLNGVRLKALEQKRGAVISIIRGKDPQSR